MKSLANALGETQHVSLLKRKMRRLGFPTENHLLQLAVARGCRHYRRPGPAIQDPGEALISNAELVTALLLSENPYNPDLIRVAGQLLGDISDADCLLKLAKKERIETCLRYIALQGAKIEPDNPFWQVLLEKLPQRTPPAGVLPHTDRFTTLTGFGPGKLRTPPRRLWLRPQTH